MENGDKENISEFEVKITEMLSVLFNFEGPERHSEKGINGGIAQLGEHLLCKQGVRSSILLISTMGRGQREKLTSYRQEHNSFGRIAQVVRAHA